MKTSDILRATAMAMSLGSMNSIASSNFGYTQNNDPLPPSKGVAKRRKDRAAKKKARKRQRK